MVGGRKLWKHLLIETDGEGMRKYMRAEWKDVGEIYSDGITTDDIWMQKWAVYEEVRLDRGGVTKQDFQVMNWCEVQSNSDNASSQNTVVQFQESIKKRTDLVKKSGKELQEENIQLCRKRVGLVSSRLTCISIVSWLFHQTWSVCRMFQETNDEHILREPSL